MCNVAGYIGSERAAPILLDMMEKQEGFGGGFYTGIATIADGQIHWRKVIGDVATLRRETDADDLPGTVGIIHSRSNGGGDVEWAHPFVDCSGSMAYIANGHHGFFESMKDDSRVAQKLASEGHIFRSRTKESIDKHPTLADGTCVHSSEVMCHLIESLMEACGGPLNAMRRAFMACPAEIVGLMVHASTPDCIIVARFNQPLMIGRSERGTYLSTTALAFPDMGMEWMTPMPASAAAAVYRDRIDILPFDPPPGKVADIIPWAAGREIMLELLGAGDGVSLQQFKNATAPLWPEDAAPQKDMMVYEIMRQLRLEGRICFVTERVPAIKSGETKPLIRAVLIK